MFVVTLLHGTCTHTHTQRLHPSRLRSPSAGVATHTGSSKITSPSTIQNQHRHPSRRKNLSCQHGPPAALPSTLKHGTVHALIFLAASQPFAHTLFGGSTFTKARHKSHGDRTSSCDERRCVCACIRCSHMLAGSLQPVPSCQFIGSSTEKRKRPIPDALIPTGSTNTLVASRHSSAHPGMRKSDAELSASNATIPHTFRLHQKRHTNHKQHLSHVIRTSFRHTATRQPEVFVTPRTTHVSISHPSKQMFLGSAASTCCGGK
ncbi:hypothetical protein TcG_11657 [Trypanosoma cruzi]|nr:hypothetical protein TcG_11657 [Trypanosoma cruzi]